MLPQIINGNKHKKTQAVPCSDKPTWKQSIYSNWHTCKCIMHGFAHYCKYFFEPKTVKQVINIIYEQISSPASVCRTSCSDL